jgi:hypothetical protein
VSDTETRETTRYERYAEAMGLGKGTGSAWAPIVQRAIDCADEEGWAMRGRHAATVTQLHEARAEVAALRGVVEAVRAIHVRDGGWCAACNDMAPCQTARALASVPSSGETESARDLRRVMASSGETEPHPQFTAFRERALANPETRAAYEEAMAHIPASPEPTGADEGLPGHFIDPTGYRFGFTCKAAEGSRCNTGCAVRCDEWGETGSCDHDEVSPLGYCNVVEWMNENDGDESAEDDHALVPITVRWDGDNWRWRITAARPVLSREAVGRAIYEAAAERATRRGWPVMLSWDDATVQDDYFAIADAVLAAILDTQEAE